MLNAILLGLVQGLTEFLPISSSAHLVIVQAILPGFSEPAMAFDVLLHAGTLVAVFAYFWKDIVALLSGILGRSTGFETITIEQARWFVVAIVIGSIPAGVAGVLWEDKLETLFSAPRAAAAFLCVTALMLTAGELIANRVRQAPSPGHKEALPRWVIVGLAQAVALLPGISRSGSTIAAGLGVGWKREDAARVSFFLMMPAVGGAVMLKLGDLIASGATADWMAMSVGAIVAGISGYIAIWFLIRYIRTHRLYPFAVYCLLMGVGYLLFGP